MQPRARQLPGDSLVQLWSSGEHAACQALHDARRLDRGRPHHVTERVVEVFHHVHPPLAGDVEAAAADCLQPAARYGRWRRRRRGRLAEVAADLPAFECHIAGDERERLAVDAEFSGLWSTIGWPFIFCIRAVVLMSRRGGWQRRLAHRRLVGGLPLLLLLGSLIVGWIAKLKRDNASITIDSDFRVYRRSGFSLP